MRVWGCGMAFWELGLGRAREGQRYLGYGAERNRVILVVLLSVWNLHRLGCGLVLLSLCLLTAAWPWLESPNGKPLALCTASC